MDYQDTLTYLYNSVPMFQQVGGSAYKEGLEKHSDPGRTLRTSPPQFRAAFIVASNGKGSCSHTLAAIPARGRMTGSGSTLSPHLVDFGAHPD